MKEQYPNSKLLLAAVIYTSITFIIWQLVQKDQSASLGYFFMLIFLWIIGAIIAVIIVLKDKIKIKNWNILTILFCSPIPFLLFFAVTSKEPLEGSSEYNKNNHRIRIFEYSNRKEYSSSVDKTSEEYPIPANDKYPPLPRESFRVVTEYNNSTAENWL